MRVSPTSDDIKPHIIVIIIIIIITTIIIIIIIIARLPTCYPCIFFPSRAPSCSYRRRYKRKSKAVGRTKSPVQRHEMWRSSLADSKSLWQMHTEPAQREENDREKTDWTLTRHQEHRRSMRLLTLISGSCSNRILTFCQQQDDLFQAAVAILVLM